MYASAIVCAQRKINFCGQKVFTVYHFRAQGFGHIENSYCYTLNDDLIFSQHDVFDTTMTYFCTYCSQWKCHSNATTYVYTAKWKRFREVVEYNPASVCTLVNVQMRKFNFLFGDRNISNVKTPLYTYYLTLKHGKPDIWHHYVKIK